MNTQHWQLDVSPLDRHNEELLRNVRPTEWVPPEPAPMYNLVVIGAGTAGLISAIGSVTLGAKVALVERQLMGGDCLNIGCVPSKSLIASSRAARQAARGASFGLAPRVIEAVEFEGVMERLRAIRAGLSEHDSADRYAKMGVHVFLGEASFEDGSTLRVGDKRLRFRKAIIATGARAVKPDIPGLDETGFLTNETVFNLTKLPRRLVVIGGGPIGCELAQAFRGLGSEVTIVQESRFLPREDPEASSLLAGVFEKEGIKVLLDSKPLRAETAKRVKLLHVRTPAGEKILEADEILIGAGRRPNVEGLGLEKVGVDYDDRSGVKVDDFLRTSNPRIYAAGDICMAMKFTHAADGAARIAIQNALFGGRRRLSSLVIPRCTYTDPEIAQVGLSQAEAEKQGIGTTIFRAEVRDNDRAATESEDLGFVKILASKKGGRILGATVVSANAGDLISEISVAMAGGIGLKGLSEVIHPYPTRAEVIRRAASAYNKTRLTPRVAAILKWWLARQRG